VCFLGYSNQHKGFKCLDPSDGRVYISRDVFDEAVFPFASLHPNVGSRLRAEIALLSPGLAPTFTEFGNAILVDKHDNSRPTNGASSPLMASGTAGLSLEENTEETVPNSHDFMCWGGLETIGVSPGDDSGGNIPLVSSVP
jgi:hypothetical protein